MLIGGVLAAVAAILTTASIAAAHSTGAGMGSRAAAGSSKPGTTVWTWASVGQITGIFAPVSMSCPSRQVCMIAGYTSKPTSGRYPDIINEAMRTTNGGKSWKPLKVPDGGIPRDNAFGLQSIACPTANRCITVNSGPLASRHKNVFVTDDGGRHWTAVRLPRGLPYPNQLACPSDTVCYMTGEGSAGLLRTTDGGTRWERVRLPAAVKHDYRQRYDLNAIGCRTATSCVVGYQNDRSDGPNTTIAYGGTLSTTDGGKHWIVTSLKVKWAVPGVITCPTSRTCITGGMEGVTWISHDHGGSWRRVAYRDAAIESISCAQSTCMAATTTRGSYVSRNLGSTWTRVANAKGRMPLLLAAHCWRGPYCLGLTDKRKLIGGRPR